MSNPEIRLRPLQDSDLDVLFAQQCDEEAVRMAAFTSENPSDREAYDAHMARIRASDTVHIRTILVDDEVAGSVLSYVMEDTPEVSYWIGREFWGRGIATRGLSLFLELQKERPMMARVAKDNLGSLAVLKKCGFKVTGEDRGFANGRGEEVEEYVLSLA